MNRKVVSAWQGACPHCEVSGLEGAVAIFMVYDDGEIILRCPKCKYKLRLDDSQSWNDVMEAGSTRSEPIQIRRP